MPAYEGDYLVYLRKSRSDIEAEQRGEGETLARHEKALLELAGRLKINVVDIYREVVSGETIAARPEMQRLLSEVEAGMWAGVLVMEVERLARGDTIDQGIVAQAFKFTGTKIITPSKTYDPENEFDEEYFEFGLFMSRREYKTINRRLQRGRIASIKEGKYVGSQAPYGYDKVKLEREKGFKLVPNPEQAEVIKMIYQLYTIGEKKPDGTYERLGLYKICNRLNDMKIPPRFGDRWTSAVLRDTMKNPLYIGKLRWGWRKAIKRRENGKIVETRPRNPDAPLYTGLHEPLVDKETFDLAQEYLAANAAPSIREKGVTQNPLAGIVICGKCGKRMQRRPYTSGRQDTLICPYTYCDNVASDLNVVEARIIEALREWLKNYKLSWESGGSKKDKSIEVKEKALKKAEAEIAALEKQRDSLHDLLERGIYDTDTFLERSKIVSARLQQAHADRAALGTDLNEAIRRMETQRSIIPKVENLLDVYNELTTPKAKNDMLKEVLEKVVYTKAASGRWGDPDDFQIDLYPKIPRSEIVY